MISHSASVFFLSFFYDSNVSKYNYCFSDYPFPKDMADYPHHTEMAEYIQNYTEHFHLQDMIRFNTKVLQANQKGQYPLKALALSIPPLNTRFWIFSICGFSTLDQKVYLPFSKN